MATLLTRRRFTIRDYYRMAEAGLFGEDDRVELIEGDIVEMTPIGSRHAGTVTYLHRTLSLRLGDRALVSAQNPIQFPELRSEPQPDLAVLRPRADFYRGSHPESRDILLVIEVADTSILPDRRVKVPLYAKAGIREVWLVDLSDDCVEVYGDPVSGRYRETRVLRRGDSVPMTAFPGHPRRGRGARLRKTPAAPLAT